jgi:hypothetical protein
MSGRGNASQQPPPSPSSQALAQLSIHPGNGQITFNNYTFRSFDDVMQHIQQEPAHRRERLLHGLLTSMIDFRDHWSDQILRFADYFDNQLHQNMFHELFYNSADYENRWGILQERIKSIRDERARCRPIISKVIKRCPAASQDFYETHFKPWGETRVTMDRLAKWLTQPGQNFTDKVRMIHNAAFDRCLHPSRTGGHTNSIIPQAEDIRSCLENKASARYITEVETQQLRDKAKEVSHYAHVWRDPATSIVYPRRPQHLIQANIPPTCLYPAPLSQPSSQPASQRSSPLPSNASDAGKNLSSPDTSKESSPCSTPHSKRRRLSQASVQLISNSMHNVAHLANSPLPRKQPQVSALGSRDCPIPDPNPVEQGLWEYSYDYARAFVNGVKKPKPPPTQQLLHADVDMLAAAVQRLSLGMNRLPPDRREAGAVLFAQGLCRGVNMCTEAQSAQHLSQMYEIIRRWEQEFPAVPTGNLPNRANHPFVAIRRGGQLDNNMGVTHTSLFTLLVDQANPTGWLNDEIVNAGIAVRSDPENVQVINSLMWDRMFLVENNPDQVAMNMPDIINDRVPALTLIPINRGEAHWVLGWIDTRTRQYGILDSLVAWSRPARHNIDMRLIHDFMRFHADTYYQRRPGDTTEPVYTINTGQSPQQEADDCGIFVIMNAWDLIAGQRAGQLRWFNVMERRLRVMNEIFQAASQMRAIPPAQRHIVPDYRTTSRPQNRPSSRQQNVPGTSSSQAPLVDLTRSRPASISLSNPPAASTATSGQTQDLFFAESQRNSPSPSNLQTPQPNLQALLAGAVQNRRATTPGGVTTPILNVSSASTPVLCVCWAGHTHTTPAIH